MSDKIIEFTDVCFKFAKGKRDILKDVSFSVYRGEVVAITGGNGQGKTTLARMVAGIYAPISGQVILNGKPTLFSIGVGFRSNLTGRQNIYLSGVILGLTKKQVDKNFKEIVEFAELEESIDAPVKHYSSGMRSRLAFSVAVHLDPEILILDEVFATGDTEFREKAKAKVTELIDSALAVVMISHNKGLVNSLAHRTLELKNGYLREVGN